ncbi:MAG: GGDEF domain-containing protein [Marinobacter sp.]|nr:GGDEF domain-containing protein [Marinobacter sp.]
MTKYSSDNLQCLAGAPSCAMTDHVMTLQQEVSRLTALVHTDTLTGLYNYRHLTQALEGEMERTRRCGRPTGLIALDLDHFKQVNDTWGHEAGNQVLVHTARLLEQHIRKLDIPCRYGGEELFIILPSSDLTETLRVAERVRKAIAQSPVTTDTGDITVTASLGVAIYDGARIQSATDFIKQADNYLYEAKQSGRNCCCHPPQPESHAVSADEKAALFGMFGTAEEH